MAEIKMRWLYLMQFESYLVLVVLPRTYRGCYALTERKFFGHSDPGIFGLFE